MPPDLLVTYLGGPTALLEVGGLRLLTDPTFDPAGGAYAFGWGTRSRKRDPPVRSPQELGAVDAVLLSHDQHEDNLDAAGRVYLPSAGAVVTTAKGAARLGGAAVGLRPWETTTVTGAGVEVEVTSTPCRHGPPLSEPIVGPVTGFLLAWEGQRHGRVWITGDTVWFRGIEEVVERGGIGTAIVHLGGVRFPITGPARYTFSPAEAARLAQALDPATIVPIHYEGWAHFRAGREHNERAFAQAGVADRVRWLEPGVATAIEA